MTSDLFVKLPEFLQTYINLDSGNLGYEKYDSIDKIQIKNCYDDLKCKNVIIYHIGNKPVVIMIKMFIIGIGENNNKYCVISSPYSLESGTDLEKLKHAIEDRGGLIPANYKPDLSGFEFAKIGETQ